MIAAILSLLGSSAVGTLLGGVFAWLNKKTDIEVKRMELDHDKARWSHDLLLRDKDLEYARTEAQGRHDVAVIEGDAALETARMAALATSYEADRLDAETLKAAGKHKVWLVFGGAMRACIRPVLTVVLGAAAIYLNGLLISMLTQDWQSLTRDQRFEMGMQAFAWITGQASVAFGYWFVSRGSGK